MPSAVEVLFVVGGVRDIQAAIGGIGQSLDKLARTGQSAAEKSARASVKAQVDAAKQVERAAKDAAKEKERIGRDELRIRNQINSLEVREAQKNEREKTRALESAERDRTAAVKRSLADQAREQERAKREWESRARTFGRTIGNSTGRALGIAGRVATTVGALGGGFAIADQLGKGIHEEAVAGQIVRSAAVTGGLTGKQVESSATAAALATGGTKEASLEGIDRFIRETGDLKAAVDLVKDLARYSAASGAAMEDLGTTAGTIFTHMKGDVGATKEALLALIGQSKTGAIDVRNLAAYGGRLVGTAELFEGSVGKNVETFGALAQLAKRKGGKIDAAEATEAASRIFGEVAEHKKDFQAAGVNIAGTGGKLRNVQDILLDFLVAKKGDITAIPKFFGRQAGGVETGLAQSFLEGSGGKTDARSLAAGRAAAAAAIQELRVPSKESDIDEGVKGRLAENDAKLNIAMLQLHESINERLLPRLPELIDKFSQLIPKITDFIDFLSRGSIWEGLGKLVGIAIAAEIAKAGITQLITAAITGGSKGVIGAVRAPVESLAALGGSSTVETGAGAASTTGIGGGALAGLTAGVAGVAAGGFAFLGALGYRAHKKEQAGAEAAQALIARTAATPEEQRAKAAALQDMISQGEARRTATRAFNTGTETSLGAKEKNALNDATTEGFAKTLDKLKQALEDLTKTTNKTEGGMQALGDAIPSGLDDPNHPGRGGKQGPD